MRRYVTASRTLIKHSEIQKYVTYHKQDTSSFDEIALETIISIRQRVISRKGSILPLIDNPLSSMHAVSALVHIAGTREHRNQLKSSEHIVKHYKWIINIQVK